MITFPTTLDNFTNPQAAQAMDAVGVEHDVQHSDLNDAVEALQAKVGINSSSDTASLDYKVGRLTTGPKWRWNSGGGLEVYFSEDGTWHEVVPIKAGDQYTLDVNQTPI